MEGRIRQIRLFLFFGCFFGGSFVFSRLFFGSLRLGSNIFRRVEVVDVAALCMLDGLVLVVVDHVLGHVEAIFLRTSEELAGTSRANGGALAATDAEVADLRGTVRAVHRDGEQRATGCARTALDAGGVVNLQFIVAHPVEVLDIAVKSDEPFRMEQQSPWHEQITSHSAVDITSITIPASTLRWMISRHSSLSI